MHPIEIGSFIDSVSSNAGVPQRKADAVAGRFIEEAVELCLAAGLSPNDILGHVTDSIHNQCAKAGRKLGKVVYPSRYQDENPPEAGELVEEIADCSLVLKDLAYITGTDIAWEEGLKWDRFIQRKFHVSPQGTLYAIK